MAILFDGKVKRAFANLRKEGFFARMNFTCCQSCGWASVPQGAESVVFYHNKDQRSAEETGELYLAWQGDANIIRRVCEAEGLTVEHNGSESARILLKAA